MNTYHITLDLQLEAFSREQAMQNVAAVLEHVKADGDFRHVDGVGDPHGTVKWEIVA